MLIFFYMVQQLMHSLIVTYYAMNVHQVFRKERPRKVSKKINLLDGSACPHTLDFMLPSVDWKIMIYPPYSSDLPSNDFRMFGPTKVHLGGQKFQPDNDLKCGVMNWLCIEN